MSAAPLGLGLGGELADQQQRGDAVLVLHVLGVAAVAERLLVAEGQALDAADPLEAGERLLVGLAGGRGHLAEQAGGHDRVGVGARSRPRAIRWWAEQRADLVAAQHPPAVRRRDRDGAAVGVGVVGHDDVGVVLRGERHGEVHRARLLGVGEGDGREVGVGVLLLLDDVRGVEPGGLQHLRDRRTADAVQRRVDDREVARAVARPGRRRCRGSGRRCPRRRPCRRRRGAGRRARRRRRSGRRSRCRPAARSGCRRRGRPCSRCPAAGCGWR